MPHGKRTRLRAPRPPYYFRPERLRGFAPAASPIPRDPMLRIPRLFASPEAAYRSRREFLVRAGGGFGLVALADMLRAEEPKPASPLAPKEAHFAPKAKRVIWLFMNGGPSQV